MTGKARPGHPPVATRFRKGQSGNPKGRPKGNRGNRGNRAKKTGSAFDVIIDRTLSVQQSGVQQQRTVEEALQNKTLQKALDGNHAARREILRMIEKREQALAKSNETASEPKSFRVDGADPGNADEALVILGIASRMGAVGHLRDGLQLEPWAVQAALGRRRGGSRLADEDVEEITGHTRDPESLQWPRSTKA